MDVVSHREQDFRHVNSYFKSVKSAGYWHLAGAETLLSSCWKCGAHWWKKQKQNISWMGCIFFHLLAGLLRIFGVFQHLSWSRLDHLVLERKGGLNANEKNDCRRWRGAGTPPNPPECTGMEGVGGCKEKGGWMNGWMEGCWRTLEWLHLTADWEGKQSG